MDTRVAVLAVLSLLLVHEAAPSDEIRVKRRADPPGGFRGRGPPRRGPPGFDDDYSGPPGQNKRNGPPGHNKHGGAPPGWGGGNGPPGLGGRPPPGRPNFGDERPDNGYGPGDGPGNGPGRGPGNGPGKGNQDWGDGGGDGGWRKPPSIDDRLNDKNKNKDEHNWEHRACNDKEFRCGSGECLPESVRCDKKHDCRDASDEDNCVTATTERQSGCVLPRQPDGGNYELGGCGAPCNMRPGDKVPRNSILTYACRNGYVLHGNAITACVNDDWYNPPKCLKTCHPLQSTTTDIACTYDGDSVPCDKPSKPGTQVKLSCKESYKLSVTNDPGYRELSCLEDGLWSHRVFRCLPECGTKIAHGNTLVVNGFTAKVGVFPWHVGIYRKKVGGEYEQICAGTLISNNLVVSAAHCFYDETIYKVNPASSYAVGAGKHYRSWTAQENYAQTSMVEKLELPTRYIGARGNFAQDIAVLRLKTPFELTALVRPICMDWDNVYEREQLQVGQSGKTVGWGKGLDGLSNEILQELNLPYIPYDQCLSAVPNDFRGYITPDKFCAGYLNGSSLCEGDSGGGLGFQMQGVWYLRGVVSVSPAKNNFCDYNSYVGFTYVSHFRDWIRSIYVAD